ncbi:MAG: hypothetical protein R6V15_05385 [Desulfotignum sp.]|jgi:hypothetical protein
MDPKKRTAALAAVYAHMKTSEEAHARHMAEQAETAGIKEPASRILTGHTHNVWGMAGRQSQMQANTMMQLRMFR